VASAVLAPFCAASGATRTAGNSSNSYSLVRSEQPAGRAPSHRAMCRVSPLALNKHRQLSSRVEALANRAALSQTVSDLPANLQKIVGAFQMVPDPKARYKQLLFFASKLPPMAPEDHTDEHKVMGCVSQVWVKPELRDGKLFWTADSDSQLTKGLAALLVQGLSDCSPEEIVKIDSGFIEMLGLKQSLTPSRNNGFLNMLRLMQKKSLEIIAKDGQVEGQH